MGRQILQLTKYPPGDAWICPSCGKEHSEAHYSLPDQIDYTKKPGDPGRILFNRRNKNDDLADDTPIKQDMPSIGDQFDGEGNQRPIYCPHCGYEDEFTVIIRTGELPDLVDQFFEEEAIDPKTWRELLSQFLDWVRRRQSK